jgi:hypothetical protein
MVDHGIHEFVARREVLVDTRSCDPGGLTQCCVSKARRALGSQDLKARSEKRALSHLVMLGDGGGVDARHGRSLLSVAVAVAVAVYVKV